MITIRPFGVINGQPVEEITLTNDNGMSVSSCSFGCTITGIITPDAHGVMENVVCAFDTVEKYVQHPHFYGAAIGRFAGRLEDAVIEVDGFFCQAKPNEGAHLLHGGADGFHQRLWSYEVGETTRGQTVTYRLLLPAQYFPGNLQMSITYTLTNEQELIMTYEGVSDADTLLSCTNHSYFNLSGNLKRTIEQHTLQFSSKDMLYINEYGLPLGTLEQVEGPLFDFSKRKKLAPILGHDHEQIKFAHGGLDHPFLLADAVIELADEQSGRKLTISTDEQALVVYTGNKIGEGYHFKEAAARDFLGICLEVQHLPNSVKYKHLPSAILRKGQLYKKETVYKFSIDM